VVNQLGQPLRTQVRLATPVPLTGLHPPTRTAITQQDGRFELEGVPPGQYTLGVASRAEMAVVTLAASAAQLVSRRSADSPPEYGFLSVDAQGGELGPLVLQTHPGANLSGRLVLETSAALTSRPAFNFAAVAAGDHFPMSDQPTALLQPIVDPELQTFRMTGVSGTMRLRLAAGPTNWWLKSATINGIDATELPVTLSSSRDSTDDAVFVLADTAGSVSGQAMAGQAPADTGWAIVFAVDREHRFTGSQWIVTISLGDEGHFTAAGLPPGDYYVAAVEGSAPLPRNETRFLDLLDWLASRARRVTVPPRQAVRLPSNVQVVAR
jgi:hypothetical protein